MHCSKYHRRPSKDSSEASTNEIPQNGSKSPELSDYEYLGRLVTRERPIIRKPNSMRQKYFFPENKYQFDRSMVSHRQESDEELPASSSEDDLNRPVGIIRMNDRHLREVYRLPTPPPKVKRVYHRLRSPEPKVIERIFVRRPPSQVIENIIEVPPEKVRIINREKYLKNSKPITRSKLVRLESSHKQRVIDEDEDKERQFTPLKQYLQQETSIPSNVCTQQPEVITLPHTQTQQPEVTILPRTQTQQPEVTILPRTQTQQPVETTLVYPPQPNLRTVGYIKSTIPPHIMFSSQNPYQISPQQISNNPMIQPTSREHRTAVYQINPPTPYHCPSQHTGIHQMTPPIPSLQHTGIHQMTQPIPSLQHTGIHQMTPPIPSLQHTGIHQMTPPIPSLQHTGIHQMTPPIPYGYRLQ